MPGLSSTAILSKLITAGMTRVGSLAFHRISQLSKVDAAIRGSFESGIASAAVADFETVIGSYYGQLDEPLHKFIFQLEKSGLIAAMIDAVLLGRAADPVKTAFTELHQKIIGPGGKADELYTTLTASFDATLKELFKDKALQAFLRASFSEMAAKLDKIEAALSTLSPVVPAAFENFAALESTLLKVCRGLQGAYRNIQIETNKGARSVEISRVFIPSKLRYRKPPKGAAETTGWMRY